MIAKNYPNRGVGKTASAQQNSQKPSDLLLCDAGSAKDLFFLIHSYRVTVKPQENNSLHHCCFRWMTQTIKCNYVTYFFFLMPLSTPRIFRLPGWSSAFSILQYIPHLQQKFNAISLRKGTSCNTTFFYHYFSFTVSWFKVLFVHSPIWPLIIKRMLSTTNHSHTEPISFIQYRKIP